MSSLSLVAPWAVILLVLAGAVTVFARRSALGDSPWYWVAIFSMSAAAALFVMDGKYRRRQDHLENEYRYGTRSVAPQDANPAAQSKSSATRQPPTGDQRLADPDSQTPTPDGEPITSQRIISLWPLRITAIAATLVALFMLICRGRHQANRSSTYAEVQR